MTTNRNSFRFNPNLYANGKVCLSLLGTWNGPGWNPEHSTLLQLLLSIQAMIFVEEPYFNEPGYQGTRNTEEGGYCSAEYNARVSLGTMAAAMLLHMKERPPLFEEVSRVHFALNRERIAHQAVRWRDEFYVQLERFNAMKGFQVKPADGDEEQIQQWLKDAETNNPFQASRHAQSVGVPISLIVEHLQKTLVANAEAEQLPSHLDPTGDPEDSDED